MENLNSNLENSEKQHTENLLSHQSFDYFGKLLLIVNDLTKKRKHLFEEGIRTEITKEMIDKRYDGYLTKIEEKIQVKSEDIISYFTRYFDECIGYVENIDANQYIILAINYGSASKSFYMLIMEDLLHLIICDKCDKIDEKIIIEILPSSSYFETINNQTGNISRTELIAFFENEKSKIKEMNNFDLLGFLNYIDGFNWRSSKSFELQKMSELCN
jgi:hypothetical protein